MRRPAELLSRELRTLLLFLSLFAGGIQSSGRCVTSLSATGPAGEDGIQNAADSSTASRGTGAVRIMTWNIRYDNPDDGVHAWARRRDELASFLRSENVDVLCIQEGLQGQVEFLKKELRGFDARGVGRDDGKAKGEYCAIFFKKSRFSAAADGTFWLSPTPSLPGKGWDAALPRIVTWVRLRETSTSAVFTVFNTHFDHEGVEAREQSAHLVRTMIAKTAGNSRVVLAGDFNSVENDPPYRILTSPDASPPVLRDAQRESETGHRGPMATFTGFERKDPDPGERIDYLFVAGGVRVRSHATLLARHSPGFLSDHLPVVIDISLDKH